MKQYDVDICVIGAGSAGLSIASGAAQLGRSVVLLESAEMGGDCLNHGCVPSKAILKAGKIAHSRSVGEKMGIAPTTPKVDWKAVKAHVADVIATIAPVDSQERFEGLGCIVIREAGAFSDPRTIRTKTAEIRAKRFVIATGSRAAILPIPGLDKVKYETNETIFHLPEFPKHLLVVGAGPIGLEMGQTFRRLGAKVTIIDLFAPLGRNEPEHVSVLVEALKAEGVSFHAPAVTKSVAQKGDVITVSLEDGTTIKGSHLLLAAGRTPNIENLGLEAAGIEFDARGIETDASLRTSNRRVYAAGDVTKGKGGLTHAAGFHAGVIIKNFYFLPPFIGRFFAKATTGRMPGAIYTEPELANIGLTEKAAREQYGDGVKIGTFEFDDNDRAIAERSDAGGVKIVAKSNGEIIGASVVGAQAGEMMNMLSLAMSHKMKLKDLTGMISPYPTRTEAVKRAASSTFTALIFSSKTRALSGFWTKFQ